jgi:hypothetical protein
MLYIHDNEAINIHEDILTIDFAKFLKKELDGDKKGKYIDRKLMPKKDEFGNQVYEDYRPFWIIDGQHRIRGIHLNDDEEFQKIEIPVIIFPKEFDMSNTAKLFAEINTLQKKLNPLHELFMQHRFSIDHTNSKRKFRDYKNITFEEAYEKGWHEDWEQSRANHMSYEILAMLAKDGPLKNHVLFLPQNTVSSSVYVSADQWVNYARVLFERKCYKHKTGMIEDYVDNPSAKELKMDLTDLFFEEINNYFHAWVKTCNHDEWEDKKERWSNNIRGKGVIQKKTHFIILIELYNLVREYAVFYKKENHLNGLIKVEEFMEILKPFKWVDWLNDEIDKTYGGGGEKGRRSLEVWMADAIINKKQYKSDLILNNNIKSVPGQGINSVLESPILEIISSNTWPTKNNPVIIRSIRPWNARYECSWRVEDNSENIKFEYKNTTSKHIRPIESDFKLEYSNWMSDNETEYIKIRVDWKNSHTQTGQKSIILTKPRN